MATQINALLDCKTHDFPSKESVLIIYNPVSGQWQNHNNLFDLIESFSKLGKAVIIRMTTGRGDATNIVREYGPFVSQAVVCGGDGTLHETIAGIYQDHLSLPIGYIPLGTTNDFAQNHHIPPDFHAAVENILHATSHPIDIGTLNQQTFNYIACFGVFTKTSYETSQALKNILGYMAYILQGAMELADIGNPTYMKVYADDEEIEGEFVFGAAVNSYRVAHLFKLPEDKVDLSDGLFELLLVRQPSNLLEAHLIAQGLMNANFKSEHIIFRHAKKIRFVSNHSVKWCADGEFAGSFTTVEVENVHNKIDLLLSDQTVDNI